MTEIIEQIRNEVRASRNPQAALIEELDRDDAAMRTLQVKEACEACRASGGARVAALKKDLAKAEAQIELDERSAHDAALEVEAEIESEILADLANAIAKPITAFIRDGERRQAEAIFDQFVVSSARAQRQLGAELESWRHLLWSICASVVVGNPHAVNSLGADPWNGHYGAMFLAQQVFSAPDPDTRLDALRRLVALVQTFASNARTDLISEYASALLELRHMGVDAASHRRWSELFDVRRREAEHRSAVASNIALRNARPKSTRAAS